MDGKLLVLLDVWNCVKGAEQSFGHGSRSDFKFVLKTSQALFPTFAMKSMAFISRFTPSVRDEKGLKLERAQDYVSYACKHAGFDDVLVKRTDRLMDKIHGTHDVDVDLVVYALTVGAEADAVVVISGDGDFIPLYDAMRARGQKVFVLSYRSALNPKVSVHVDQVTTLLEESLLTPAGDQGQLDDDDSTSEVESAQAHSQDPR